MLTSQRTQFICAIKTNYLMLFEKINGNYCENYMTRK